LKSFRYARPAEALEKLGDDHRIMEDGIRSKAVILLESDDVAGEIITADLLDRLVILENSRNRWSIRTCDMYSAF